MSAQNALNAVLFFLSLLSCSSNVSVYLQPHFAHRQLFSSFVVILSSIQSHILEPHSGHSMIMLCNFRNSSTRFTNSSSIVPRSPFLTSIVLITEHFLYPLHLSAFQHSSPAALDGIARRLHLACYWRRNMYFDLAALYRYI